MKKTKLFITFFVFILFVQCAKENDFNALNIKNKTSQSELKSIKVDTKMILIPGGYYEPFFGTDSSVYVKSFYLDEKAVTNKEYLEFVKINPQWRKSNVNEIYADSTYLHDWQSDLILPKDCNPDAPVTYVSWFAANAFAKSIGKRLPTVDEWEFVAMADADTINARKKQSYSANIIDLYMQKNRQFNRVKQTKPNYWGVYNMFDLIWEWTHDFNSIIDVGDSRIGQNDNKNLFCASGAANAKDVMNYAAFMRYGMRISVKANYTISNMGFRCAKDSATN